MSLAKTALALFSTPSKSSAGPQSEQSKRTRKEYYLRNRTQLLRASKQWKLEHAIQLKRYQRRYKRQVDSGARVPKGRGSVGLGYVFTGPKDTGSLPLKATTTLTQVRDKRL